jgi:hypothetical protein
VVGYKQGVGGAVRDLFTQSSGAPINFFSKLLKKLLLIVYVYVAGLRRSPALDQPARFPPAAGG